VPKGLFKFAEENDREIEENAPEEGEAIKQPSLQQMTALD